MKPLTLKNKIKMRKKRITLRMYRAQQEPPYYINIYFAILIEELKVAKSDMVGHI